MPGQHSQSVAEIEARQAMAKLGLHPLECPTGEDHHTDMPFTRADEDVAELAYWLGGLFIDKEHYALDTPIKDTYWYNEMSSLDIWKRVGRALRIHGLKIVDAKLKD